MLNRFTLEGVEYIQVTMPSWMKASKLIADHVNRGDVFAVNAETGDFHMIKRETWKALKELCIYPISEEPRAKLVDVQFYRKKLREISASAKAALGE